MFHVTCGTFLLAKSRNPIFTVFLLLNTLLPSAFISPNELREAYLTLLLHLLYEAEQFAMVDL